MYRMQMHFPFTVGSVIYLDVHILQSSQEKMVLCIQRLWNAYSNFDSNLPVTHESHFQNVCFFMNRDDGTIYMGT